MENLPCTPATGATKKPDIKRMLRVNHAGEYGAKRIYEGQLAVLKQHPCAATLQEMLQGEEKHLAVFDKMLPEYHVRPTLLHPLWHVGGFALGAATALLGAKAAMACTIAVEEVIGKHYEEQAKTLAATENADYKTLQNIFTTHAEEELHHQQEAIEHGGEQATGYPVLRFIIGNMTKTAIKLAERI